MQLAAPENLWFLLLLVPMLLVYVGYWIWKQRKRRDLGDHPLVEAMSASRSSRLQVARAVLIILSLTLLVIASARPQWGQINRPIKRMGVDVVFAMDLSRSMLARDASPSRLGAAKYEIETTMELLSGDRVGLVVFTAVSFAQSPLTTDYGAIRFYLDKLSPEQMPMGGTSVGRAILDAVDLLEAHSSEASAAENRVIVLITDGEDHESDPISAARAARDKGIHIVTVGIGSEAGERIPILNSDGSIAGYKRDRQGNIVRTKLDESTLEEIADITNGRYINYDGRNSVANGIVDFVNELEKTELETLMRERYEDRFIWFAAPALLLLLIAIGLGDRRRRPGRKFSNVALVLLVGAMSLTSLTGCERPFEKQQDEVSRANELVDEGNFEEALKLYDEAQAKVPTTPELSYNRGRALLGLERWEEAQEAFARALETEDPSLRFDAYTNLGLALAGKEEWSEAYDAFRAALRIAGNRPDLIDKDRVDATRRDLEVAFRKLYPPCSRLEDDREEDDTPSAAGQLEGGTGTDLTLCGSDDDWFLVPAIPGTTVSVEATFEDLRDEPDPEQVFARKPQDIQLALFASDGETVLAVDQGEQSEFRPDSRRAKRSIEKFLVQPEMVADGEGIYVKVKAADALEFSYDIEVTSIPPCRALQEATEPNDDPTRATPFPPEHGPEKPLPGHICGGDDDFYTFDVEIGDALFFDVIPSKDEETGTVPELEIALFDHETGQLLAEGTPEAGLHTVGSRLFTKATTVHLHVRGATPDAQGPYQIVPYHYPPCVIGDDRYEDNDDAGNASELAPDAPMHRYLRLCESDPDFYRIPFPQDEQDDEKPDEESGTNASDDETEAPDGKVELGLSLISTPTKRGPTASSGFSLDLMSETGDQILEESIEAPESPPQVDGEAPAMPLERILAADELEGDSALVRVTGPSDFYHLVQLNPQKPPQQDQEQQQQDEQDSGDEGEKQEEEQDGESGDQDQDSEEENEGRDSDPKDGDSEQEDDAQPQEESGDEQEDESSSGTEEDEQEEKAGRQARPGEETREPGEKRIEDILRALEESDDNFQMKKALEKVPGRFIEKDW